MFTRINKTAVIVASATLMSMSFTAFAANPHDSTDLSKGQAKHADATQSVSPKSVVTTGANASVSTSGSTSGGSQALYFGLGHNANVASLQQTLQDLGYYAGPITGNFLTLTEKAVKAFQKAHNIETTGVVGPLTRAALSNVGGSKLSLVSPVSGSVALGNTQTVTWTSTGKAPATVSVKLIRKVADNPARYEVVRTIASSKSNNGKATWVPASTDIGSNLTLEVGCGLSAVACQAAHNTSASLAVVPSTQYQNTASAYEAIEAAQNQ